MATLLLIALTLSCLQVEPTASEPRREKVDLPGFEEGDLYVLSRLSNEKLVNVERSEWVYVALLIREGLDLAFRKEAIVELARLRKTDELTQILEGITRAGKTGDEPTGALNDLIGFLKAASPAALKKKRDALSRLASGADHERARQAGYAALILADGAVDRAWRLAEKSEKGLVDLLNAVPMISDRAARAAFSARVEPLVHEAPSRGIRQSAILAIASVPGREREAFAMLAALVREGTERDTAIEALERLPPERWPEGPAQDLVDSVMKYVQGVDPTRRNTPEFKRARQLGEDLATLLPVARGREVRKALSSLGIRIVTVRPIPYRMAYDRVHIVVQAGQPLEITFENPDTMAHNLVIVVPGALAEIGIVASHMVDDSENWHGKKYVPNSEKVLFATRLLRFQESDTIRIVAPETVGEYPYLCTYPGHWASMSGILHVVDDVDAWIVANPEKASGSRPEARDFVRAWRTDDLVNDLDKLEGGRDLQRGEQLFTAASCVACHQVRKVGGLVGPNLTEVSKRLAPAELLAEIIEPSKTINEKYRTWVIALDDGSIASGIITKQDAEAIHLVGNPLSSARSTEFPRERIITTEGSSVSTMPMGLLNTLTREEILDLLAYVRSSGDPGQ